MITTAQFLVAAEWMGVATLVLGSIALLGFLLKWGIRFRMVGITGFAAVLTFGLFALGLVPFAHTVVPGATKFSTIYDGGKTQVVIAVSPQITEPQLTATLQQAANNLFSPGRLGQNETQLTIRARTVLHPEPGVTHPLVLGQVKRSLADRTDDQMQIEIYRDNLAQLPPASEAIE